MHNWITSMNRKRHQRLINKTFRMINKNIENDELWKGRFMVKQAPYNIFHIYEDKSGAYLFVNYIIIDKQTGMKRLFCGDTNDIYCCPWKLYQQINDFIIHTCKVWEENPRPHESNTKDYRKARVI